jgi:hypothetical protein
MCSKGGEEISPTRDFLAGDLFSLFSDRGSGAEHGWSHQFYLRRRSDIARGPDLFRD